ncbi:UNVERIFIED_CONTAM: hypothetical protein FKN15_041288 [Acipenser sinensis]
MEPWPAVAWVLVLSLIADWLKAVHSREFTVQDIIYLHPSTTPYPGGFKCFTCENASDNYECNRWAPDVYCPQTTRYCFTRHKMDSSGESLSVTKRCVALEDCLSTGCTQPNHEGQEPALPGSWVSVVAAAIARVSHAEGSIAPTSATITSGVPSASGIAGVPRPYVNISAASAITAGVRSATATAALPGLENAAPLQVRRSQYFCCQHFHLQRCHSS